MYHIFARMAGWEKLVKAYGQGGALPAAREAAQAGATTAPPAGTETAQTAGTTAFATHSASALASIRLTRQTVKVGPVRWRWSMDLALSPQGLYLQPQAGPVALLMGRLSPVLIPWSELNTPRSGRIYLGWQAVEMSVGSPEIAILTFPLDLYHRMLPFLPPSVASAYLTSGI